MPKPFTDYRGITVIVEDPNVIAALDTGGYAATAYLNSTFVTALAAGALSVRVETLPGEITPSG